MSVLINALKALKKELEDIVKPKKLTRQNDGLDSTEDAKEPFASPSVLLGMFNLDDTEYTDPKSSSYPDNAIQAIWNIADIASYATNTFKAALLIKDSNELNLNFAYLHDATWVPKIIDDKTHRAGLALIRFLSTLTTDENALDILPTQGGIKESVSQQLQTMKALLEKRIELYELHQPEPLQLTVNALRVKKERRALWEEKTRPLLKNLSELEQQYLKNWTALNQHRGSDSTALVAINETLKVGRELLLQQLDEFKLFKEQWHKENQELGLPSQIKASELALSIGDNEKDEQVKYKWLKLYNRSVPVYDEGIGKSLDNDYQRAGKIEEEIVALIEQIDQQSMMFEERIGECEILKQQVASYAHEIQAFIDSLDQAGESPAFINTDGSEPVLVFTASQNENRQAALAEDSQTYSNLLQGLKGYKQGILDYQRYLINQLALLEQKFAIPANSSQAYVESCQSAFNSAQNIILQQIALNSANYEAIVKLQLGTLQKKNEIDFELARMSTEGRQKVLETSQERVREAFGLLQSSQREAVRAAVQHNSFMKERYEPAMRAISQYKIELDALQSQIDRTKESIDRSTQQMTLMKDTHAVKRRKYLTTALSKLTAFQTILQEHKGLYIPAQQIPKDELTSVMECKPNSVDARLIEEMYATEESSSAYNGANWANITNRLAHGLVSYFGTSVFEWDIRDLRRAIDNRLTQIDDELKIVIDDQTELPKAPANLPEDNLYTLSRFYRNTRSRLEENRELLEQLQQTHDTLSSKIAAELPVWQEQKAEKDQELAVVQLHHQLNRLNHELAMLASNSYQLEYQLDSLSEKAGGLGALITELASQDSKQVQALYESNLSTYGDIDKSLDAKASYRDYSTRELGAKVRDSLSALARTRVEIEHLAASIQNCPETLREKLSFLNSELESLQSRGKRSAQTLADLQQDLPESHSDFNGLGQLAQIHNELSLLLAQSKDPDLDEPSKLRLIETIEKSIATHADSLDKLRLAGFDVIRERAASIDSLINSKEGLLHFVTLNKLEQINASYSALQQKVYELAEKQPDVSLDESLELCNEINDEIEKHQAFLQQCKEMHLDEVQDKVKRVASIEDDLRDFIIDPYQYVPEPVFVEPEPVVPFENQIADLQFEFFGSPAESTETNLAGVFGDYLQERAVTYAWSDYFSSIAAIVLGCFGYQTESAKRQSYLIDLHDKIQEYKDGDDESTYQPIMALITEGMEKFSPRAKVGDDEHDKSLFAHLSRLQEKMEEVERSRLTENEGYQQGLISA